MPHLEGRGEKRKKDRCGEGLKPLSEARCLQRAEGEVSSELPVPSLDVALAVAMVHDWEVC